MSRWFLAYTLVGFDAILLGICLSYIAHYWPAITSTALEVYQCAAALR
jgi:hypothetical protein